MRSTLALAAALLAVPAFAQTATPAPAAQAKPAVGATVNDQTGAPIGTITTVTADAIVIDTGTNKVPVPPTAVGSNAKGLYMAMTKAQLDAAATQHAQARAAALTAGAAVASADNQPLGTVKAVEGQTVVMTTTDGKEVRLPATGFTRNTSGAGLTLGFTAAQFAQAVSAAAPATPATGSTPAATDDATPAPGAESTSSASATPAPASTPAPAATPTPAATPRPSAQ